LVSNTWFDTDSIVHVSTSVDRDLLSGEIKELHSSWESSLSNGWHVLGMGVTFTTRSHKTNRKNEVLEVLHSRPSGVLVSWDILDSKLVRLGFSHLGGISSKLVDEIATSDHFKSTSSFSLSDCTISSSLDEFESDTWSGRSVLPSWDAPWELKSNVVSTFSHSTSGSWKSEIDSDGG